eukprot:TRINITY_DN1548_c1_g1_i3.p1 TRINITY_DN1548_c1_g1~~TRINITY_DN1548_c1_g1_i3.p1  ORF type:complete len:379 (+),score=-60.44 TRINITY_DN1548_c1_g1_i3:313-1449(+)
MKDVFSGFYTTSQEDLIELVNQDNILFIFDTNVLLYLYSYTKETRDNFFKILDKLSGKIWLPYHVGLEYQRKRLGIVRDEKAIYRKINTHLDSVKKIFEKDLKELNLNIREPKLSDLTQKLKKNIVELIDNYQEDVSEFDEKQPCVNSSDEIRKELDKYFLNKVGVKPTNDFIKEIIEDGKTRYSNKVPPGYMDEKDKKGYPNFSFENIEYTPMYGDLIIWKQIIEKAKDENIKSIVFITDDEKEDWIYEIDSGGKKKIGARAELRQEIQKEADISNFEILSTTKFMELGKTSFSLDITEKSLNEAEENISFRKNKSLTDAIKDVDISGVLSLESTNDFSSSIRKSSIMSSNLKPKFLLLIGEKRDKKNKKTGNKLEI